MDVASSEYAADFLPQLLVVGSSIEETLQIDREPGNRSRDRGDGSGCLITIAPRLGLGEDGHRFVLWINEPILRNAESGIEVSLQAEINTAGRGRDDLDDQTRRTFHIAFGHEMRAVGE